MILFPYFKEHEIRFPPLLSPIGKNEEKKFECQVFEGSWLFQKKEKNLVNLFTKTSFFFAAALSATCFIHFESSRIFYPPQLKIISTNLVYFTSCFK